MQPRGVLEGPGRWVTSMVDVASDRVAALTAREEEVFRSKRARSRELWEDAKKVIPRGVPSSFQDTPPQPVFIDYGKGSRVWDVDGNEYVDFHNGFGVMVVGHAHPAIVAAVDAQMHRGSHFAQPVAENIVVATRARAPVPAAAVAIHEQRHGVDARRDPPGARLHRIASGSSRSRPRTTVTTTRCSSPSSRRCDSIGRRARRTRCR